jgi:hypothetical protein
MSKSRVASKRKGSTAIIHAAAATTAATDECGYGTSLGTIPTTVNGTVDTTCRQDTTIIADADMRTAATATTVPSFH